jgi:hypothetical protein
MARNAYYVAAFNPFWRYAVALEGRPDLPAIPFFRKANALAFYDESVAELPWAKTVLLQRRPFGRVQVVGMSGPVLMVDASGA